MATTSPLRQRMIEDMTIRNLSQATQQSYICAVRRHIGKSPARLGIEDVRAYQLNLIAQKRSWSHINQTVPGEGPRRALLWSSIGSNARMIRTTILTPSGRKMASQNRADR